MSGSKHWVRCLSIFLQGLHHEKEQSLPEQMSVPLQSRMCSIRNLVLLQMSACLSDAVKEVVLRSKIGLLLVIEVEREGALVNEVERERKC